MRNLSILLLFLFALCVNSLQGQEKYYGSCEVKGGKITTTDPTTFCVSYAYPNAKVTFTVAGAKGPYKAWIAAGSDGIIDIVQYNGYFDFSKLPGDTYRVWHISWKPDNYFKGPEVGKNVKTLTGCYDVSNSINVRTAVVNGGTIATADPTTFCVNETYPYAKVNFSVSGAIGSEQAWFAADAYDVIRIVQDNGYFDFGKLPAGTYNVWHVRWQRGYFDGLKVGEYVKGLRGCFDLSNAISVKLQTPEECPKPCDVDGGVIKTTDPTDFCINDAYPNAKATFTVTGAKGPYKAWIAVGSDGIIDIVQEGGYFDFSKLPADTYYVWHISWKPDNYFKGPEVGKTVKDITGCYDLSNPITVRTAVVNGGTIATKDPTTFCVNEAYPHAKVNFTVSGSTGPERAWFAADAYDVIRIVQDNGYFDFGKLPAGTYRVWHVRWQRGYFDGLKEGENVEGLSGCFDLSNAISVKLQTPEECPKPCDVDGGTIVTYDMTVFCRNDAYPNAKATFTVSGAKGPRQAWFAAGTDDIIRIVQDDGYFDFSKLSAGTYRVWHIRWQPEYFSGLEMGKNFKALTGCYDLSNAIAVTTFIVNGGTIATTDPTTLCDSGPYPNAKINFTVSGAIGSEQAWFAADADDIIRIVRNDGSFDFSKLPVGTYRVWHIRWSTNYLGGLVVGKKLSGLLGCFDLSNAISVKLERGYDCAPKPVSDVVRFLLIDANKDEVIREITNGAEIDLSTVNTNLLSIEAVVNPTPTGSVRLSLEGPIYAVKTENTEPYTLFGEDQYTGDIAGRVFPTGDYSLTATAYTEANLGGKAGKPLSVRFRLVRKYIYNRALPPAIPPAVAAESRSEEPAAASDLRYQVYPNPVGAEALQLRFDEVVAEPIQISLMNQIGSVIGQISVDNADEGQVIGLQTITTNLSAGVYFLQVRTATGKIDTRRIVKIN